MITDFNEAARGLVAACKQCGADLERVECWQCGGSGYSYHDCGDDCCCCLYPEDNVECDICRGDGSFTVCPDCHPGAFDD